MKREDGHIVESATEARAGKTGQNVRYVLVASTTLCVVLFLAVYVYFFT
jgi:hypothetical protein